MIQMGSCIDNRYEVTSILGQGGMGRVYLVKHKVLNTFYALKEAAYDGQEATDQFQTEARILATLSHSGLPRVSDYFSRKGKHYLVMDYIEGQDLDALLEQAGKPFSERDVNTWCLQLLNILNYIHGQGIVHRDLKPANIKLTPQGQIMLVDFGLAKQSSVNPMTCFGAKGYTPYFAAPEQIQGQSTDARSDLYALGVTAAYLLTRALPPPMQNLAAWIQKATAMLPASRFQTAQEMIQAVRASSNISMTTGFYRRDIRRR